MTTLGATAVPPPPTTTLETTVLAALEVLYQPHSTPDQVQGADAYLRAFQITPDAFHVADALLEQYLAPCQHDATHMQRVIPVLFFASQTLANKLRRQHALPTDTPSWSFAAWAQKLAQWLAMVPPSMPKMVPTQLILALIACLPRIPVEELVTHQQQQHADAKGSAIGYLLDLLTRMHVRSTILAEVLVVAAEELSDQHERTMRERMHRELDQWAGTVLNQMLPQLMQDAMHQAQTSTQEMVLRATRAWIRYARVPVNMVVTNALLQSLLVFVRTDDLFDVSVDLVVEIVRCYADTRNDLALIQWLVPQLMQLRDDFHGAARDEDTDKCLGLCRIFTEMGESYMDLLVGDVQMNQTVIVDLLLDCMSYPDADVADVTIPFWFRFLSSLHDAQEQQHHAVLFQPQIIRLASIAMQNLHFPDDFPKLPADKIQDFKAFRQDLGDILRDCCDAIGVASILSHCVQGLQTIFQLPPAQRQWQAIEAHLYCIRSIGRNVERADTQIVSPSLELIFQNLAQLADHASIQYTACLIISRYTLWLRDHTTHLAPLMAFLHQCIVSSAHDPLGAEWQVPSAAATALRSLAIDCWSTLGGELLRFYLYVEQHDVMAVEDQVLILEGICQGVSRSNGGVAAVCNVLEQVQEPIVKRLSTEHAAIVSGQRANMTIGMQELLRILSLYDYVDVRSRDLAAQSQRHPLVAFTERIWTALDQLLSCFRGNDAVVERICRCYKRMLRTCGSGFKPFLPRLVENVLSLYQQEPKCSYLYAASMVLKHFHEDSTPEIEGLLVTMVLGFVETTLPLFKTTASMSTHPDIMEEFFYFAERSVRTMPQLLLHPVGRGQRVLLSQVFECAVAALQISHNEANRATLCFLEHAVRRAVTTSGTPADVVVRGSSGVVSSSSTLVAVRDAFVQVGRDLVDRLLRGVILGTISRSRLDEDNGSIAGVLAQIAQLDGHVLQQWIDEWFTHAHASHLVAFLTHAECLAFARELFTSTDERTFRRVIRHFGKMCATRTDVEVGSSDAPTR